MNNQFRIGSPCEIHVPNTLDGDICSTLWSGFTLGSVKAEIIRDCNDLSVTIGNPKKSEPSGADSIIDVSETGISVTAKTPAALMRGFMLLLTKLEYEGPDKGFYVPCGTETQHLFTGNMLAIHICVFPETDLDFLQKTFRTCAVVGYTHIVLEFWGMYKFKFMKELAWDCAFSSAQIKPLIDEVRSMGVEIIPMFNHLGHASASRIACGKHVVLDQNPALEHLFYSNGWIWKTDSREVKEIMRNIRRELCELCGEGKYFHLGCDEAYLLNTGNELAEYLNDISKELEADGRRGIIWADMMLYRPDFSADVPYECNAESKILVETLRTKLDKKLIIADWQYSIKVAPWETSLYLKDAGFDTICCPWDNRANVDSAIKTVAQNGLYGFMHTTWHTINSGFPVAVYAALAAYGKSEEFKKYTSLLLYSASLQRKAMPSGGCYQKTGWVEKQISGTIK